MNKEMLNYQKECESGKIIWDLVDFVAVAYIIASPSGVFVLGTNQQAGGTDIIPLIPSLQSLFPEAKWV